MGHWVAAMKTLCSEGAIESTVKVSWSQYNDLSQPYATPTTQLFHIWYLDLGEVCWPHSSGTQVVMVTMVTPGIPLHWIISSRIISVS